MLLQTLETDDCHPAPHRGCKRDISRFILTKLYTM